MNRSLYGRKWALTIKCKNGDDYTMSNDGFSGKEPLKMTFKVEYPGYEGWYFSEFTIWNPKNETARYIVDEGAEVYLWAGYKDGNYGQIFGGKVFQSLWDREDVTDYKLTLLCMDGERLFKDNFSSFTLNKNYKRVTLMNMIASKARSQIPMGKISSDIDVGDVEMPRGATFFGAPVTGMREVVRSSNAFMFMKDDKLEVAKMEDAPKGDAIEVNPSTGLIGTPQQIDYGISFRTLLNPNLMLCNPLVWVKLDMSEVVIRQQRAIPGKELVPLIPSDGYFKVGGVRHIGDTRGDDWYTDVTGYSLTGKAGLQLTTPEMMIYESPI